MNIPDNVKMLGLVVMVCVGAVAMYYFVAAGFMTLLGLSLITPAWLVVIAVLMIWRIRRQRARK